MSSQSLSFRLVASSAIWMVLALFCTGWVLSHYYKLHVERHFDAHLTMHVEELLASMYWDEQGHTHLQRQLVDPRFNRPMSGWYWSISRDGQPLLQSVSLGDYRFFHTEPDSLETRQAQLLTGPGGQALRAAVSYVAAGTGSGLTSVTVTAPQAEIREDISDYKMHIFQSLLVLGAGLMAAIFVQVKLALKPLQAIQNALGDIRNGLQKRLPNHFPSDVQVLANEINALISHNETLLKRARNQLADLAHVVKNPLAIIRNEARQLPSREGQLILDQSHVMSKSIDNCLSRARVFGRKDALGFRTRIAAVIEDLCFALSLIYRERSVEIHQDCDPNHAFPGEVEDLEEMLGNLLDNACKWARSEVRISSSVDGNELLLQVDDDGPGIPEQERAAVLERGRKLDDSSAGHGQGLGIVRDLAGIYGGSLQLTDSSLGGLCAQLRLPAT